jgi:uncharacterized protein YggE
MQMLEHPWGVTAYGAASVKALPDLARIRFKVAHLDQTPSRSFDSASAAVQAVRHVLRSHDVPDAAVGSSRLDLRTIWVYPGGSRTFFGYQCQAAFAIESASLDDLQQLLVDLVAAGANEIDGVDFDVSGKRELRAQARQRAVAAARGKAELYAEAAGVRLGAVVHIDDVDPEQAGVEPYRGHGHVAVPDAASEQELAPGHVVVSAAVVLGFAIAAR